MDTYQGGIPYLQTRSGRGQRGSGFFSSLKKFLMPIGRAVLPEVIGGVGDMIEGKSFTETAKSRGRNAGKKALDVAGQELSSALSGGSAAAAAPPPPSKAYKRSSTPRKPVISAKKQRKTYSSWA